MAEAVYPRAYGVAEITYYLKQYLEEDGFLAQLAVAGQISGYKAHPSGHCYFQLREGASSLKAVMFRRYAVGLDWQPRDGDQAVAVGAISLYERDGCCQLYVQALLPAGAGREARQLAELKQRLAAEGLFSPERKRPLPLYPLSVGVITSREGAAWADIRRIAGQRHPGLDLRLYPALVQGEQAPASLAAALAQADRGGHEVLLLGRGGGRGLGRRGRLGRSWGGRGLRRGLGRSRDRLRGRRGRGRRGRGVGNRRLGLGRQLLGTLLGGGEIGRGGVGHDVDRHGPAHRQLARPGP